MASDLAKALRKLTDGIAQKLAYDADMMPRLGMDTSYQSWPVSLTLAEMRALANQAAQQLAAAPVSAPGVESVGDGVQARAFDLAPKGGQG